MGKLFFRLFGLVLIVFLTAGIIYVSLLGENDRATSVVKAYFENIANKQYGANSELCTQRYNRQFNNLHDPITYQFALETSLLKHFGLINTATYAVETKRDGFWVPYLTNGTLHVSIEIHPKESSNIFKNLFSRKDKPYLKKFVTLVRKRGQWKIDNIDIHAQTIVKDFQKTEQSMQNSRYIRQTAHGLIIKENSIDFETLGPIQKRILIFNLNKALTLLKKADIVQLPKPAGRTR